MLSLPKILLFLAVVVCVVMLSKAFRGRAGKVAAEDKDQDKDQDEAKNKTLDLSACAVCGNYVAADGGGCERVDCPIAKGGGGD